MGRTSLLVLFDPYFPEAGREAIEHGETTIWTQWIFALAQRAAVLVEFGPSGHSGCIGPDEVSRPDRTNGRNLCIFRSDGVFGNHRISVSVYPAPLHVVYPLGHISVI